MIFIFMEQKPVRSVEDLYEILNIIVYINDLKFVLTTKQH